MSIRNLYNCINNLFHKQKAVFAILLFQLMFTTCIMLFTEHINWAGKIALFFVPFAIQILLLSLVKKPGLMFLILIPKLIIDAFQFVILILFGSSAIAVDMFLNLTTTNGKESGELLSNIFPAIIFLVVFYGFGIFLGILSVKNRETLSLDIRKRWRKAALVLLAVGIIFIGVAKTQKYGYKASEDLYPYNVFCNMGHAAKMVANLKSYPKTSQGFTFGAQKDSTCSNREIVVLILGETERAINYGLLGYKPNTCEPLDTIQNLAVYTNVLTQSNTTHKIVPLVFSATEASNHSLLYKTKSIVTAFKEAGFKTAFLSNQKYNGTFAEYYFNEADYRIAIRENNIGALDHELLGYLDQYLSREKEGNLFIILHLYGSHFNYKDRYSKEFAKFLPDKAEYISVKNRQALVNSYNNSILSTADLVAQVIGKIDAQKAESSLIYLSDHGEDLMDDRRHRFLHASPIPTYYQLRIPFICWNSKEYIENHQEKRNFVVENRDHAISNNVVFHSLLDLAGISTRYFKPELSICSPKLMNGNREYLTDRNGCIKVKDIPMRKIDFEMFRKEGIEL